MDTQHKPRSMWASLHDGGEGCSVQNRNNQQRIDNELEGPLINSVTREGGTRQILKKNLA